MNSRELSAAACRHDGSWDDAPTVSVLVLNWNGKRFLGPCLESLMAEACPHVEIVLVDNGSKDDSVAYVRREFPAVRVIRHEDNLGFSRGYNAAVAEVQARFLVFLNNDTVVNPGWLGPLIQPLMDSGIGLTTAKVRFMGTNRLNAAGGYMKLWSGEGEIAFGQAEESLPKGVTIEPFFAYGAAMAITRDLFEHLDGFDEGIFAYGEDTDLSWKARLAGYTIRYVPESVVHHHCSGSFGLFNAAKVRMVTRHRIRVLIKCLSWHNLAHALPAYIFFACLKGTILSLVKMDVRFGLNVALALLDSVRGLPGTLVARRRTQHLRKVSDSVALKSEGFGLMWSPGQILNILRVAQRVSRESAAPRATIDLPAVDPVDVTG